MLLDSEGSRWLSLGYSWLFQLQKLMQVLKESGSNDAGQQWRMTGWDRRSTV